jgi:hypothetical protein
MDNRIIEVRPVELDDGGYDDNGSYWGVDAPLWCVFLNIAAPGKPERELTYHVRAETSDEAAQQALADNFAI